MASQLPVTCRVTLRGRLRKRRPGNGSPCTAPRDHTVAVLHTALLGEASTGWLVLWFTFQLQLGGQETGGGGVPAGVNQTIFGKSRAAWSHSSHLGGPGRRPSAPVSGPHFGVFVALRQVRSTFASERDSVGHDPRVPSGQWNSDSCVAPCRHPSHLRGLTFSCGTV